MSFPQFRIRQYLPTILQHNLEGSEVTMQDPHSGERTSYPQNWYPVMLSSELDDGPVGADFLGTRVVAFRRTGRSPVVLEAYCLTELAPDNLPQKRLSLRIP